MPQTPTWDEEARVASLKAQRVAIDPPKVKPVTDVELMRDQIDLLRGVERLLARISRRLGVIELILIIWFFGSIVAVMVAMGK